MRKNPIFFILLLLVLALLNACEHCPDIPDTYESRGRLSSELLKCIPYNDGELVFFKYGEATTIPYRARRKLSKVDYIYQGECSNDYTSYEADRTLLISGDDVFNIEFRISNLDTDDWLYFSYGSNDRRIPVNDYQRQFYNIEDTMTINGKNYFDVILIKFSGRWNNEYYPDSVQMDSLYYNYTYGILKLTLQGGRSFERID